MIELIASTGLGATLALAAVFALIRKFFDSSEGRTAKPETEDKFAKDSSLTKKLAKFLSPNPVEGV